MTENSLKTNRKVTKERGQMIQQQSTVECTDKNNVEITSEKQQDLKQSFVIYSEWEENCTLLSNEQKGQLFSAILAYGGRGEDISSRLDGVTAMCFSFIKNQLKRDAEKYQSTIKRNSENGKKGGRPKKQKDDVSADGQEETQTDGCTAAAKSAESVKKKGARSKKTTAQTESAENLGFFEESQKNEGFFQKPKKADNDNDNEDDNVNDNDNDNDNDNVDGNDTDTENEDEYAAARAAEEINRLRKDHEAKVARRKQQLWCVRVEQMFDEFWNEYPKKENMVRAKRAFMGLDPDEDIFKTLMKAVKRSKADEKWQMENGRFIPLAANYILDRRFEDRVVLPDGTKERSYDMEDLKRVLIGE